MGIAVHNEGHHVIDAVAPHLATAYRREGAAYARVDKSQIVIYLRGGGYCRAGILGIHLLLDGYCRRYALYGVNVWFAHPAQELTGVGRKALGETSLALCKKGIERQ